VPVERQELAYQMAPVSEYDADLLVQQPRHPCLHHQQVSTDPRPTQSYHTRSMAGETTPERADEQVPSQVPSEKKPELESKESEVEAKEPEVEAKEPEVEAKEPEVEAPKEDVKEDGKEAAGDKPKSKKKSKKQSLRAKYDALVVPNDEDESKPEPTKEANVGNESDENVDEEFEDSGSEDEFDDGDDDDDDDDDVEDEDLSELSEPEVEYGSRRKRAPVDYTKVLAELEAEERAQKKQKTQ